MKNYSLTFSSIDTAEDEPSNIWKDYAFTAFLLIASSASAQAVELAPKNAPAAAPGPVDLVEDIEPVNTVSGLVWPNKYHEDRWHS